MTGSGGVWRAEDTLGQAMAEISYLNEEAAAEKVGVSPRTLQRWRSEGGGPAYTRAGARSIKYCDAELDRWLLANTFRHRAEELARAVATDTSLGAEMPHRPEQHVAGRIVADRGSQERQRPANNRKARRAIGIAAVTTS
jgi:hypothetical protein